MGESASLQLLDTLLELGPDGGSREHLVHKAGVSTASFYRAIKPLMARGLVEETQGLYTLPLSNFHNYRYKLWRDADRLHRLPSFVRDYILDLLSRCQKELGDNLLALWLVGSAANDEMHAESDLDFLAVLEKETELYHPKGQVDMNFVTMEKDEFQANFRERDGFVLTVLRRGLLLLDRDFAQPYLSVQAPVGIDVERFHEDEKLLDELKSKLLFFVKMKEDSEIRRWLSSYAVNLGRLVLRLYGHLPAGKNDLVEAVRAYVGEDLANALSEAIWNAEPARTITLQYQLEEWRILFHENATHFKRYAGLPSAPALEFEELCRQMLTELAPGLRRGPGDDLVIGDGEQRIVMQCKSTIREVTEEHLRQLAERTEGGAAVMVVNAYRELPVPERPDLSEELRKAAESYAIRLISGPELLRMYTRWRLDGGFPEAARAILEGNVPDGLRSPQT